MSPDLDAARARRVLFLDFDGCLDASAPGAPAEDRAFFAWLSVLVELLADHGDVGLVVHSSWRYTFQHDDIREFLGELGPQFLSTTPRAPRQESILRWLQMHPQILDYRVIDDDANEFDDELAGRLILCLPTQGLRDAKVQQRLREWLATSRTMMVARGIVD